MSDFCDYEPEDCPLMAKADELAEHLEGRDLPKNFVPDDDHLNQILAYIRHEYTNYDFLLSDLIVPGCHDFNCPLRDMAHDALKWAAKDIAEQLYLKWERDHE